MRKVFVSYSRTNLDVVTQLVDDLQAVGMTMWYDQNADRWPTLVGQYSRQSSAIVRSSSSLFRKSRGSRRRAGASWPMFVDSASLFFGFSRRRH
jgi:hypothetical protein